mmetsp:Transcript_7663/g.8800  ORF Transcript_7663/g.8800 Transcript_7663/m.8800 type:complete len:176 (+) Transcript_7663:110-637(+)
MAQFCGVGVGVAVVCLDSRNRILIGKRKGSHGAGTLALPGGHLELNEEWETCARRELLEEAGVELQPEPMRHIFTTNDRMENDKHYVTIFLVGKMVPGSMPKTLEPHKCEFWQFCTWKELKEEESPVFLPLRQLLDLNDSPPWQTEDVFNISLSPSLLLPLAAIVCLSIVLNRSE